MTGVYGTADEEQSVQTLLAALERGVNFIDTSDAYGAGENEKLLGRVLQSRWNDVVLGTKFGLTGKPGPGGSMIDNSREYIGNACDASLRRLGVETIDLYYAHRRDPQVPIEELVGTLADLVRAGKVRHLGLCEVSSDSLRRAHAIHPITAIQSEYSLWSRDPELHMLATCREIGVTFVAYAPLGRGFLSDAVTPAEQLPSDDIRRHFPRFQGEAFEKNRALLRPLAALAAERGVSRAVVALAWLLAKGVVAIPGTKHARYMIENTAAGDFELTAQDIADLDALYPWNTAAGARSPAFAMQGTETDA
jgi:aryl-alcohol dehydrogenase-like predicted oxidoreductase